ncbi:MULTISPECIES: type I-E CRISPR-associated protein Cse2/CasB [unclassified Oceanobacter]|uniref:type I-E CRISPR-associated protein Cse2/CasB n=1 Tax=unclassified Oceanobacter TaxID=2620260 RepID=UPI002732802E|nr:MULTISPECIES: type I-E CRISPR-associated protein Cse2/CasB [unclassified Oceanobacter]MDP2610545.1 type I-E CRISPR-associated protein Cse2/CasB [Oceanobacter sp. 1_MG-2023]MDP2613802.1 type I-E CRISPR-associated protein Cse2/CasB [Oceanobacter sp. 2_MG-2023]
MDQNPVEARTGKVSKAERFIAYLIDRINKDNGFAARLKRADNPATEYQSWELLAEFGVDLEKDQERLPYCTVAAALARAKPGADGKLTLGAAIAACYTDNNQSDQAKARLRRLLACTSTAEACRILRPLLTLMASRGVTPDFSQLLKQLLWFAGQGQERVRIRWAQDFYRKVVETDAATVEAPHD